MESRRQFITRTAAVVAAAPFISTRVTRALAANSRPRIGWALCGLGGLSEHQIAPALLKSERCRLAGIITDTPDKAKKWQAQYRIPDRSVYTYDTMAKMADNKDIDVIYIVTPNALHADQAAAAFKAGKHVFCEKPMEISVERCQKMINDAKAANRKLAVAYRCQYDPNNLECIRIARAREFGDIKIVEATFNVSIGDPGQWRLKRALSGGGALMDVGIYALQAARYLTGEEPIEVTALEGKTRPQKYAEVDESMIWQMRFPSGAIANCSSSYETGLGTHFRVYAEKGWFGLDPAFLYSGNHGMRSDRKEIRMPDPNDMFALEMDDFSRCILENRQSKVSGEEGLRDVRIMMAIYEAARTGRTVKLEKA
jgi:predicted dehydrogenase